jgi:hypothetical protein
MPIKDQVITDRENILSMISCRNDYGHNNQITDHFFWQLLEEKLVDTEIIEYAESILAREDYDQEDYDSVFEDLTMWRNSMSIAV